MAEEVKKTWIKQGSVDSTYEDGGDKESSHVYFTTNNLIDNSGIYAIVRTKDGSKWNGNSSTNIEDVTVYTTKGEGTSTYENHRFNGSIETGSDPFYDYFTFPSSAIRLVGVQSVAISDIPCFHSKEDAQHYIDTGDWSNAENAESLQTANVITRVYVDNSTPPNLKIVFDIDEPEESTKQPPGMIWLRFWKTKDYADIQGATMFKQQGFQFGGNVSYTWSALEFMGGGKDLAIETSTHADNSDNVIAYVADNGTCQPLDTPISNAKNSIVCIRGNGDGDDGYKKPTEDSDGADENASANVSNLLTTTYKLSQAQLQSLGNFLWQDSFMNNIKLLNNSPIENLVSVKALPVSLPVGSEQALVLGNVDTGIKATPVTNTYIKFTMGT